MGHSLQGAVTGVDLSRSEVAHAAARAEVRKPHIETVSTTLQPHYKHHTNSIEPTKDKSPCSIKVAGEKAAELAHFSLLLGQLQPFMAVPPQECMGQLASSGPA
jgi:hypothetical protein